MYVFKSTLPSRKRSETNSCSSRAPAGRYFRHCISSWPKLLCSALTSGAGVNPFGVIGFWTLFFYDFSLISQTWIAHTSKATRDCGGLKRRNHLALERRYQNCIPDVLPNGVLRTAKAKNGGMAVRRVLLRKAPLRDIWRLKLNLLQSLSNGML